MFLDVSKETGEKIQKIIEQEILNRVELITQDEETMNKLTIECIKGQIKAIITELIQSKEYKNALRDRILNQLCMKEIINEETH